MTRPDGGADGRACGSRDAQRGGPTVRALAALVLVALLAGCSAGSPDEAASPTASTGPEPSPTAEPSPTPTPEPDPAVTVVATASVDPVEVFASPDDAAPTQVVAAADAISLPGQVPVTFVVTEQREDWLQVLLPVEPQGSSGWVRAADVALSMTDDLIEVRSAEHRLLLHRGDEVVLDVAIGLGAEMVPVGRYFLKELLQPPTAGGVYGAYAYGLSGYPPALVSFAAGRGVVGIHGTNQPTVVGTDPSVGCIVMTDADIVRLVEEIGLPLGTPVEVVA
ncbi:L,D-transpeptidase [Cellulomonas sp. KRMCY2]|uniref:L,D-transpeptidase n=1 Tax=Cellulomonas sp. KRMCY2 TaxID=1304865 RepID=UPI00045EB91D|nr:L,D-transpeptidase [Cellulomonas sp. KRMCY2]